MKKISERHMYSQINNEFKKAIVNSVLIISKTLKFNNCTEIVEIPSLKWFIRVQFYTEYKSKS